METEPNITPEKAPAHNNEEPSVTPGQEVVLYDPSVVAGDLGRNALHQYITGVIEHSVYGASPKYSERGLRTNVHLAGGWEKLVKDKNGKVKKIGSGTPYVVGTQEGNDVLMDRDNIKDAYLGNVVNLTMQRRARSKLGQDSPYGAEGSLSRSFRSKKTPQIFNQDVEPYVDLDDPEDEPTQEFEPIVKETPSVANRFKDWRKERAKKRKQRLEEQQKIISESTKAIWEGKEPNAQLRPMTGRDVRQAEKTSRQRRKALRHMQEKSREAGTYGARPEKKLSSLYVKGPLLEYFSPTERNLTVLLERLSDMGTEQQIERLRDERYTSVEKRHEKKAIKRYKKELAQAEETRKKVVDRRDGKDLHGKLRDWRIRRADRIINS